MEMSSVKYVGLTVNQIIKGEFTKVRLLEKNTLKINSLCQHLLQKRPERFLLQSYTLPEHNPTGLLPSGILKQRK